MMIKIQRLEYRLEPIINKAFQREKTHVAESTSRELLLAERQSYVCRLRFLTGYVMF